MKRVDKQDFDGGWIPVTHKHASHGGNFKSGKQPLITLFVDNLPEDTSQPWLKMMFNKFGVVKEVFIPGKRSKTTGNRFGFVRYDCAVSADLAILRTNGIWLDDKKLFVKLASFEAKGTKPVPSNSNREGVIYQTGLGLTKEQGSGANVVVQNHTFLQNSIGFSAKPSMSYSEALKGGTNVNGYSKIKSVIVAEVTDSWLQRSAIAKLKSFQSIKAVHKLFFDKGFKIAQIKPMGGLNLVITFHSIELLDSLLAEENLDFSNWFVSFQKWNGQACPPSRNVWLSCFGVPLNVWCDNTFLSIGGLWGDVVALEEKTQKSLAFDRGRVLVATNIMDRIDEVINLSINGALAKVRVIEDLTSYFTSSDDYNFGDEIGDRKTTHSKIVDEEDDMAPDLCKLTHAEGCKINSQAEVNARKDCTNTDSQKSAIREDVSVVGETPINNIKAPSDVTPLFVDLDSGASQTNNVEDSDLLADGTFFGGNSPTLTDKGKGEKRVDDSIEVAVCEEDDIPQAVKKVKIPTPEYEDQEPSWSELPFHKEGLCPVKKKVVKKNNKRLKNIGDLVGLPKAGKGRKKRNKCVLVRSAIAAAALSISSEGIKNRNRIILNEEETARTISKIMSEDFMGNDEEVLSNFMALE